MTAPSSTRCFRRCQFSGRARRNSSASGRHHRFVPQEMHCAPIVSSEPVRVRHSLHKRAHQSPVIGAHAATQEFCDHIFGSHRCHHASSNCSVSTRMSSMKRRSISPAELRANPNSRVIASDSGSIREASRTAAETCALRVGRIPCARRRRRPDSRVDRERRSGECRERLELGPQRPVRCRREASAQPFSEIQAPDRRDHRDSEFRNTSLRNM